MTIIAFYSLLIIKLAIIILFLAIKGQTESDVYKYRIEHFKVPLDHFSYTNDTTFNIRYLINDSFVQRDSDPIFFYTGNEGDIVVFAENTGFLWEAAEQLNAIVVFAEHRYYGTSLPFPNNTSYKSPENLGYLSSQQALADYADLLRSINKKNRPVIAFGGSYGGMLAAWFRMKYPHIVLGAIASSAPIFQFEDLTPCDAFNRILTSVFATAYKPNCPVNIKRSWDLLNDKGSTPEGKTFIKDRFVLCKNLTDVKDFIDYLTDVYGNLAMVNYPFKANFLAPLPAYPVRKFCSYFSSKLNDSEILPALSQALQVYHNSTGKTHCLDISSANAQLGAYVWDFQACTEMVMPMCSPVGSQSMFLPEIWDFNKFSDECFKKFHVRPRLQSALTYYGDKKLTGASNIVFSNGLLDPWSGGGVLRTNNAKIHIIIIPDGAHHIDLRASNPEDPNSVKIAREYHIKYMKQWLRDY